MPGRLSSGLRRWPLPFWAVFTNDLGSLLRSWVLRIWLVLTAVCALVMLLGRSHAPATGSASTDRVLAAVLHPGDADAGEAVVVRELLRSYVVLWAAFVIVLTAGTICSELSVVADSVLSRGISRWQYFMAKLASRLVGVLGVYLLVMVPTALVIWLRAEPAEAAPVQTASVRGNSHTLLPAGSAPGRQSSLDLLGAALALAHVGGVLGVVVTGGVALSACFTSTVISIVVTWVTLYGTGLIFSMLDLKYVSPARLLGDLTDMLRGNYVATEQFWTLGCWLGISLFLAVASGAVFARRDI